MQTHWKAAAILLIVSTAAHAGSPEKDRLWAAAIDAAKARGGVETVLDKSASYVFRTAEGDYVSLTRLLKSDKRSVCEIAKDEHATLCVDWDTGRATLGHRVDNASPWVNVDYASLDEAPAAANPVQSFLAKFLTMFSPAHKRSGGNVSSRN